MAQVNSAKALLRKQMMEKLRNISAKEVQAQSEIICEKVISNPVYQKSRTVSIYLSMRNEVQTMTILENIFQQNKECYIPRFQMGGEVMEMVRLNSLEDFHSLPLNKWNIRQPSLDENRTNVFDSGSLDLVIVPGLAFTSDGRRLGHGKGYYDKFLSECRQRLRTPPRTVALAFSQQLLNDVPTASYDVTMDLVITDTDTPI